MRNKDFYITSPKKNTKNHDLITIIIFEKPSNIKLKSNNFPFIKVYGKSLLDKQLDVIRSVFTNVEVIFVCGTSCLKIFDYINKRQNTNIRLIENQYFNDSNCCESIKLGLINTFNNKVLILPEDTFLSATILSSIDYASNSIFINQNNKDNNLEIGAVHHHGRLENLSIGIKQDYWTEILFLKDDKILKELKETLSLNNFKNKLFFEAVNHLSYKHEIRVINTPDCIKLNNAKVLKRINNEGIN